ncbi:MAG: hypothetical protein LBI56_00755 [Puniceicoccales bacterium]|jgi:hypothetical protein|nr:hypothetical protein [Puniceicoccales bacterium]
MNIYGSLVDVLKPYVALRDNDRGKAWEAVKSAIPESYGKFSLADKNQLKSLAGRHLGVKNLDTSSPEGIIKGLEPKIAQKYGFFFGSGAKIDNVRAFFTDLREGFIRQLPDRDVRKNELPKGGGKPSRKEDEPLRGPASPSSSENIAENKKQHQFDRWGNLMK